MFTESQKGQFRSITVMTAVKRQKKKLKKWRYTKKSMGPKKFENVEE